MVPCILSAECMDTDENTITDRGVHGKQVQYVPLITRYFAATNLVAVGRMSL